jgi:hypothetical protein
MTATWVVLEARIGSRNVWVWGRVHNGPGFTDQYVTAVGGDLALDGDGTVQIVRHLFTFTVEAPDA